MIRQVMLLIASISIVGCAKHNPTELEKMQANAAYNVDVVVMPDGKLTYITDCEKRMACLRSISMTCPNGYTIPRILSNSSEITMTVQFNCK